MSGPKLALTATQWREIAAGEWWHYVSQEEARAAHAANIAACRRAVAEFQAGGKIKVLVIHASGRSSGLSSARECSNSQMLLRHGLEAIRTADYPQGVDVEEVSLRDYRIEPCDACFLSPDVKVYGLKDWRPVGQFSLHKGAYPSALNRHGKFAPVLAAPRPAYTGDAYTICYRILDKEFTVEVTADHQFFGVDGRPVPASGIRVGDALAWVGLECQGCGQAFRLPEVRKNSSHAPKFCSDACRNAATGRREGDKRRGKTRVELYGEAAAAAMSARASKARLGKRLADVLGEEKAAAAIEKMASKQRGRTRTVTEAMTAAGRKRRGIPLSDATRQKLKASWEARRGVPRHIAIGVEGDAKARAYSASRAGKTYEELFSDRADAIKRSIGVRTSGKTYEEMYGSEMADRIRRQIAEANARRRASRKMPWTEDVVAKQLTGLGVSFLHNHVIGHAEADFVIGNLIIQVEGCYWHACRQCFPHVPDDRDYFQGASGRKATRRKRIAQDGHRDRLLSLSGYVVERVWEHELRDDPGVIQRILESHGLNHAGGYKQFACHVVSVSKRPVVDAPTYCLTMDGDPSFVIDGGLASHNCYSTSSSCCGFPCDSFPLDGMQELYPKVLRADCLLISTPTNQAAMASRLKLFVDRLISLDGGYFTDIDQYAPKDAAWRERRIELATTHQLHYDQRLHNKVAAFFISNKDDRDTGQVDDNGRVVQSYVLGVAESLYRGFYNFGCAFPDPFYVAYRAVPQEDLAFDKQRLDQSRPIHERAGAIVLAALRRVMEVRCSPLPPTMNPPGRT